MIIWGLIAIPLTIVYIKIIFAGAIWYEEWTSIKNNIKRYRGKKNFSQQDLADIVGVSRNTISSLETGQYEPLLN